MFYSNAKPNFIIGFDLIGNEDAGDPLHKFANELTDLPPTANFFFHAGETSKVRFWTDNKQNFNLDCNLQIGMAKPIGI